MYTFRISWNVNTLILHVGVLTFYQENYTYCTNLKYTKIDATTKDNLLGRLDLNNLQKQIIQSLKYCLIIKNFS